MMIFKTVTLLSSKYSVVSKIFIKNVFKVRINYISSRFCHSIFGEDLSLFDTVEVQKCLNLIESGVIFPNKLNEIQKEKLFLIKTLLQNKKKIEIELNSLKGMSSEDDTELQKLVDEEKANYLTKIKHVSNEILSNLSLFFNEYDDRDVEIQIIPAIGGDEAKLFAGTLFNMYANYATYKNWECHLSDVEKSDFKTAYLYVSGNHVFSHLKYEAGVHRVQRVPETEKSGRVHTSTCSVAVLPQPKPNEVLIKPKDIIIEKIRSSGPGGQNVNKRASCVRITHIPTGIVIENQTSRYQEENKSLAFKRLAGQLYNMEIDRVQQQRNSLKKQQVKQNEYSDKIRTYNYGQNRVTDHRIHYSVIGLKNIIAGNRDLDEFIYRVQESTKKDSLLQNIELFLQSVENSG